MLPGRTFLPEDLWSILRQRFWLLVVPFAVVSAATALYVRFLPDVYRADALISIVPPKITEGILKSATTASVRIEERIPAIRNEIMSRSKLERIIQDMNLYAVERRAGIMQDIVERMQSEINVAAVGQSAIRVQFMGGDARTAMRVTDRLAALFIEESQRDRKLLIEGTDSFLEAQLKETLQRLTEKEQTVLEYRRRFDGELPDQVNSNLSAVQSQQAVINQIITANDNNAREGIELQRQIADLDSLAPSADSVEMATPGQLTTTRQRLNAAQQKWNDLKAKFTDAHPEVVNAKALVLKLEAELDAEDRQSPISGDAPSSPAEQKRRNDLKSRQQRLAQIQEQTAQNNKRLDAANKSLLDYRRRVDAGAKHQTEMFAMNRDYGTIQSLYQSLLSQKEQSNLASSLERREIGEQFRLVDPARMPARPFSPNRRQMNLMGMAVGLAIGLVLVGLLEYRDSTFKADDEITRVLGVPVLAVVPLMQSEQERRRAWQRRLAVSTVLGGTVVCCLAILAYTFAY